jgi:hypothetical protein
MDIEGGPGLLGEYLVLRTRFYAQAVNRDATFSFELTDRAGVRVERAVAVHLLPYEGWEPLDTGLDTDLDTDLP